MAWYGVIGTSWGVKVGSAIMTLLKIHANFISMLIRRVNEMGPINYSYLFYFAQIGFVYCRYMFYLSQNRLYN